MSMWPSILAGVTNYAGQYYDSQVNQRTAQKNIDMQREINAENIAMQYDFAKHGISWKVDDAINSGLHPLAALGAQVSSAIPSSVAPRNEYQSNMGQNIAGTLNTAIQVKKDLEIIHSMELDNELKALQIKEKSKPPQKIVKVDIPSERIDGAVYNPPQLDSFDLPGIRSGTDPFWRWVENERGYQQLMPSQAMSDLISEGEGAYAKEHWVRYLNNMKNALHYYNQPYSEDALEHRSYLRSLRRNAPEGYEWRFNPDPIYGGWKLFKVTQSAGCLYFDCRGKIGNSNENIYRGKVKGFNPYIDKVFKNKYNFQLEGP